MDKRSTSGFGLALHSLAAGVTFLTLAMLAGCAVLSTGERVGLADTGELACHSHAGSYALPKTFLKIMINRVMPKTGGRAEYFLQEISQIRREDPRHTYCVDYNPNPTAQEKIHIVKTKIKTPHTDPADPRARFPTATNLLHYVSTDVIDRSRVIAQKLIETLFRAASGAGRSLSRDLLIGAAQENGDKITDTVLDVEFDPFQPGRTAVINDALREYGFCVMLGGYTVDLEHVNIDKYCDHPISMVKRHPPHLNDDDDLTDALERYETRIEEPPEGILYRPEIAYNLYIFGKKDRSLSGGWQLRVKRIVKMENISPIVSVGVDRTFFAQRRTTLVFKGGVLKKVCIYKTSELLEFVQIPLTIVKSIVVLPTQILQFRIDDVKGEAELVAAQNTMIAAQKDYLAALQSPSEAKNKSLTDLGLPKKGIANDLFATGNVFPKLSPEQEAKEFGIDNDDTFDSDKCPKPTTTDDI